MSETEEIGDRDDETPTSSAGAEVGATDPVLIVLDPDDPARSVRRVLDAEDLRDGAYYFLLVYSEEEWYERRAARQEAGITREYSIDHLREDACREAKRVVREWTDMSKQNVFALGEVGAMAQQVVALDSTHNFDRIYVPETDMSIVDRLLRIERIPDSLKHDVAGTVIVNQ